MPVTPPEIGWQLLDSAEVNKTNAKLGRRANKVLDAIFSGSGTGHVVTRTHRTPPGPLTPIHGATLLRPQGASATRWIIRDFFNIQTFAEMTILFGINCENISMALHRTKLRDLAETAKVVSGRKFIRNSGEICSLHHKIEDRWARSYSGQASPDLRLSLWLCTKPHSSIAIQLKIEVKVQYHFKRRSCFIKVFLVPNNLTVKQWALLPRPWWWGLGTLNKEYYKNHSDNLPNPPLTFQNTAPATGTGHCWTVTAIVCWESKRKPSSSWYFNQENLSRVKPDKFSGYRKHLSLSLVIFTWPIKSLANLQLSIITLQSPLPPDLYNCGGDASCCLRNHETWSKSHWYETKFSLRVSASWRMLDRSMLWVSVPRCGLLCKK